MTLSEGDLYELVRGVDPTIGDPPPEPGSARFAAIEARAVAGAPGDSLATSDPSEVQSVPLSTVSDRRGGWVSWRSFGVAASVAAGVVAFAVLAPGQTVDAKAAVAAAAANIGDVASLRASYSRPNGVNAGSAEIEFSNGDVHLVGTYRDFDSNDEPITREFESTIIGDIRYDNLDGNGKVIKSDMTAEGVQQMAPFTASAEDVVTAALTSADTIEVGTEQIRGVAATHYQVRLDSPGRQSLKALPQSQLYWFGLDYPDDVTQLDLWVAGGVIRKISVLHDSAGPGDPQDTSTMEFYDFGADITIDRPAVDS